MKKFMVVLIVSFLSIPTLSSPATFLPLGSWLYEGDPGVVYATAPALASKPFEDQRVQEWFINVSTDELTELTISVAPETLISVSRGPHCPGQCSIAVAGNGDVIIGFPRGLTGKLQGDILRIVATSKTTIQAFSSAGFVHARRDDRNGVWRTNLYIENLPTLDEISFRLTSSAGSHVLQRQAGGPNAYFSSPGISTRRSPKEGDEWVSIWDPKKYQMSPRDGLYLDAGQETWQSPRPGGVVSVIATTWGSLKLKGDSK